MESQIFTLVILPILIFLARVADVSVGTLRIAFIARGRRIIAPVLGFIEVLIWILAIGQVLNNVNNVITYIAYAGGFAAGNFVGMWLEDRLAVGYQVLRIITSRDAGNLISFLKEQGIGVTVVDATGQTGAVKIIFTILKRKDLAKVERAIKEFNPRAFYSIEDVRTAREGIFPGKEKQSMSIFKLPHFKWDRKGK
jgi:uncharacterized protein YebE (UPF0316 family)